MEKTFADCVEQMILGFSWMERTGNREFYDKAKEDVNEFINTLGGKQ